MVEVVARVYSASTTAVAYCQPDGRDLQPSLLLYVASDRQAIRPSVPFTTNVGCEPMQRF